MQPGNDRSMGGSTNELFFQKTTWHHIARFAKIGIAVGLVGLLAPLAPGNALASAPASPSTHLDWETSDITSANGFQNAQIVPNGLSIDTSEHRTGTQSLKVRVAPGDDPLGLGTGTERAELANLPSPIRPGMDQHYSWSTKFANDWQTPNDWGIIWQTHGPDSLNGEILPSLNPPVAVSVRDTLRLNIASGAMQEGADAWHRLPTHAEKDTGIKVVPGKWFDIILHVKWSATNDGAADLYLRQEGEAEFTKRASVENIPTLISVNGVVGESYVKHGLYRNGSPFINTLWHDNFSVTSSLDAAKATWSNNATVVSSKDKDAGQKIQATAIANNTHAMIKASNADTAKKTTQYVVAPTKNVVATPSLPTRGSLAYTGVHTNDIQYFGFVLLAAGVAIQLLAKRALIYRYDGQ